MKSVRILAIAAVAASLACSEGIDPGQLNSPDLAKGKPDLTVEQVCEGVPAEGAFFVGLWALCGATADPATEFTSRNNADRDRWGLIAQLNRAGQKCSVDGDAAGAVSKLTDFVAKVLSLRASDKIAEADGVDLAGDGQSLIDSFNPDLTVSPWTCPSGNPAP